MKIVFPPCQMFGHSLLVQKTLTEMTVRPAFRCELEESKQDVRQTNFCSQKMFLKFYFFATVIEIKL